MATVNFSGPFFDDAEYASLTRRMVTDVESEVARRGVPVVRSTLASSIRVDGGPYADRHVQAEAGDIRDNNAVYGPWLEGTGSRNSPVTRFPGYASFRRATQQVEARAAEYAQPAVDVFVSEVNS